MTHTGANADAAPSRALLEEARRDGAAGTQAAVAVPV